MGVKRNSAVQRPCKALIGKAFIGVLIAGLLFGPVPGSIADPRDPFAVQRGKVALDAGHGGKNLGGRGPRGALEKDICLSLVRRVTTEMEPDYQIVLTRSDDYNVALHERTALANNQKAELFISIHTAAGFLQATTGITIYSFHPVEKETGGAVPPSASDAGIFWNRAQMPHAPASRALAETLRQTLSALPGVPEVRVLQAPLAVLKGAQMPAVLIELGYLTNPGTEEGLNAEERQTVYARAIAQGIDNYLAAVRLDPE
ncbi:MAG: N-acetylmuramoyl-L-alanine amidase [Desulfobacteraceae bacterium]|nr:MAG: N-acetylmuramoyl-L-alanine amidase [Desulfobacteraceae bacterium]